MKKPYTKPTLERMEVGMSRDEHGLDSFVTAKITRVEIDLDPPRKMDQMYFGPEIDFTWYFEHTGTEPFDKSEFDASTGIYERLDELEKRLRPAIREEL